MYVAQGTKLDEVLRRTHLPRASVNRAYATRVPVPRDSEHTANDGYYGSDPGTILEETEVENMAPEPDEREPLEPEEPTPDLRQALSTLSNRELLSTLDLTLLELERRLYRYAHEGEELIYMADEGLLLASRAGARLGQALSAAEHAEAHLQVVGVGEWRPTSTHPSWDDEPRLTEEDSLTEENEEDS